MSDAAASPEATVLRGLAEPTFDPNAMRVLKERYFAKKPDGTQETPKEFLWRVASAIAQPERPYAEKNGRDPDAVVDGVSHAFYDMMARRDFMPNTPCLVNAGRPLSMLSACFVLPVPDSIEGIFYNLKAMARVQQGGGGCISGDARVWSTFCGIEPIEVLFSRTTADGRLGTKRGAGVAYDVRDLNVKTLSMHPQTGELGLRPVSHVWKFDVPAEDQVVVRMREGTRVQTSSWHPFMVVRGTALVEVRAHELEPGDVVLGPENPEAYWPWKDYQTIAGLTLDEELAWLIGFTLGDGSFGRNKALGTDRVRWFSGTEDVLYRVRGILAQYGIEVGVNRDPRGNGMYVTTASQWFIQALKALCGIASNGPKDLTIRVPEMIGKSPLPVVHSFLAGLLDSDGNVDKDGSPSYTSASEAMAEDLAALLGLLGFQPTIKCKQPHGRGKHPTYTVLLARRNRVDELAQRIAFYMSCDMRKQRLRGDLALDMRQLHLPFRTWRDVLKKHGLIGDNKGAGPLAAVMSRWACNYAGRTRRTDLLVFADVLEPHDAPLAALLRRIGNSGQEIKSVEKAAVAKPFYDLSVDDWNTYAAGNGGMTMIHNTGFAFSQLRPSGSLVATTGRDASGPVSFMKVFNAATDSIKQGGVRRGANMAVLRVDHPDIFDFMRCKKELDSENRALWNRFSDTGAYTDDELAHIRQELLQTQMNNFNISVGVTDAFMNAVETDGDFDLIDPRTKIVVRTVRAREIWDAIVEGAWQNGEPGVIFLDHPEANPLPGLGPIEATNPCVTGDTWVTTSQGARQVKDLIGVPFEAIVDGKAYPSTGEGFFFSGIKPVFELRTNDGYSVKATADHKIMTIDDKGHRFWKPLGEFDPDDAVVLHDHGDKLGWEGRGTFDQGWLLGNLVGDGHFHENPKTGEYSGVLSYWGDYGVWTANRARERIEANLKVRADFRGTHIASRNETRLATRSLVELAAEFAITPDNKRPTPDVEAASSEFIRGFLRGWFDADGTVGGNARSGYYVRLTSCDLISLESAQRMLARFGIVSRIFLNRRKAQTRMLPDGKGGTKAYDCKAYHELSVPRRYLDRFQERVDFSQPDKLVKLYAARCYSNPGGRSLSRVASISPRGDAPVFDCTIPGPHSFDANCLVLRNCGEQLLHGYDSCNLGSINVGQFYNASVKDVDWERLAQAVTLSIRFLDNVIDANLYPLKEIEEMVLGNRRVGLGIMGFAELLIQMEVAYGSPEAIAFAEKLMKFMQQRAEETSEQLARERGEFPNKHLSVWADDPRPRRNAALLSIAPTGTISMIAGCSFGCEPYFGMAYTKHVMKDSEGRPQHLYYVVPLFEEIAKDEGFFSDDLLARIEDNRGSVKGLPEVPQHWQEVFTTSSDVTVDQHIDMLAAFQKHVCNATSKTINAPNDDTKENVARSIMRAYKKGCKGFTYYRDGSRTEQVVTFSREGDIKGVNRDVAARTNAEPAAAPGPSAEVLSTVTDPPTDSLEELDIEQLLAKANALLETR